MQRPQPTPQHERLAAFVGEWSGEARVPPNPHLPEGATFTSRIQSARDLDGWFVTMRYEQDHPDGAAYRALGIVGWDQNRGLYTFYWFDSDGWEAGCAATGLWEDDRLTLQQETPMGHNRYTFEFPSDDTYHVTLENSEDAQAWSVVMEERFRRA